MRRFSALIAACTLTGCMNLTFSQMVEDPGPHDSPLAVVALGGIGDLGLAATAAAAHAESSEELAFQDVILYYALPLVAVDLLVAIIRIDRYRN